MSALPGGLLYRTVCSGGMLAGMPTTSIKVPVELRDRLSALARQQQLTLAAAITRALDIAETAEFWERVRTSMPERVSAETPDADELGRTLADGLEPDEDWTDVL
mgnify:CR=1 FL=1